MFRRLFLDHPASVGESYAEHFGVAARFGTTMLFAGGAALVHAVLPFAFKTTGSRTIVHLHRRLVDARAAKSQLASVDYVI